jgi:prepilin signal peptidase PulO-like enzyme (type II secretory pathway)
VELLVSLLLISLCLLVSLTDLLYTRIPNAVLLVFLPLFLLLRTVSQPQSIGVYLLGGIIGALILLLPALMKPDAVGMGDVKLLGTLGLAIGWKPLLLGLFLSSFFAFVSAVVLLLAKRAGKNDSLPFAPWLSAGAILAHFWGGELLSGYWIPVGQG